MALEMERKSVGVRHLLKKLRGVSPHPLSPEDDVQDLLKPEEGAEKEAELGSNKPKQNALLPRG